MNTERAQNQGHAVQWIDATEAARRLGISPRAVQKRCAAGKMKARRVPVPGGIRWELDGRELGREPTNEQGANHANQTREPDSFDAQNGANLDANPRTNGREPTNQANGQEAQLRDELARERDNAAFLRGVIEQLQRDGAETRAALRKALEVGPRQLAEPQTETARNAQEREQKGAAGMSGPRDSSGARMGANGEGMDAGELLDLCRRICG